MTSRALPAAATSSVRELLDGPVTQARVVGTFATACYVELPSGPVVAVLARDAVRLPCGLVLAQRSSELRLDRVPSTALVGGGLVSVGDLSVRVTRTRSATVAHDLSPEWGAVDRAAELLAQSSFSEHPAWAISMLDGYVDLEVAAEQVGAALLGGGTGLTPSGDDVLAGFLVAAYAVGVGHELLARAVAAGSSRGRTTPLSATLLRHAANGEAVPQVAVLIKSLCDPRWSPHDVDKTTASVVTIGHTSGVALATGVVAACRARLAAG